MAAFFVFVFVKAPLQIVGDTGVNSVVRALDEIDEIHKFDLNVPRRQ